MILGVLIGNLDLNLGYVAGFLILRKKIMDYRIYTVW